MNLKEWVKNALLLQKCYLKILNILENKNSSRKINNQEIIQMEYNLNRIFQFLKQIIKKTGNNYWSRSFMKECKKQEKIN
jgi:hypothetical protein